MAERGVTSAAANCLRIDHVTVEVVQALSAVDVPSLLLKGPVVTDWLYDGDRNRRPYSDVDLLVPPDRVTTAQATLDRLGFACVLPFDLALPHARPRHAEPWFRARDGVAVDLHRTIHGAERADRGEVWRAARRGASPIDLLGHTVDAPGEAFRTLHTVLHVRPYDAPGTRAWGDLTVALATVPEAAWRAAAALAAEVGVTATMGALLARRPDGAALALRLGLPTAAPLWLRLEYDGRTDAARFLAQVVEAPGRDRIGLVRDKLLPPDRYRAAHPTAGERPVGAVRRLAPLLRPHRLGRGLGRGLRRRG